MLVDNEKGIVLFDGLCHLCDGAVRFILKRERVEELKFAPLQSDSGKSLLQKYGYSPNYLDGLILIEGVVSRLLPSSAIKEVSLSFAEVDTLTICI